MKPLKNKVFCYDCGRQKMLFETEVKAQAFMRFNNEEIESVNGYAPIRSYFCNVCGGWHLTSKMGEAYISPKTEKILEEYETAKRLREERKAQKLIQEKKKEILEKIICIAENNIQIMEFSSGSKYAALIDETVTLLEKIKSIKANFKGSNQRKRQIEIKLSLLAEKFRNSR
jgi:ribosomal protein S27E